MGLLLRSRGSFVRIGLLALTLAACSAVAGLDGDFDRPGDAGVSSVPEGGTSTSSSSSSGTPGSSTSSSSTSSSTSSSSSSSSSGSLDDASDDATDGALADSGTGDADAGTQTFCGQHPANAVFCWDFSGNDMAPNWGWSDAFTKSGSVMVNGSVGDPARMLVAQVQAGAVTGTSGPGALLIESLPGFSIDPGETLALTFTVRVTSAGAYALVGGFELGGNGTDPGVEYGLAVNTGCGSGSCFQESDRSPNRPAGGTPVNLDTSKTYEAQVTLTHNGSGSIDTSVSVGVIGGPLTLVEMRSSDTKDFGTGTFSPVKVIVGAGFAGATGGSVIADIDNVLLVHQ